MNFVSLVGAFVLIVVGAQSFDCPRKRGMFPDPAQCDRYFECKDGKPKEFLCADGLVFDKNITRFNKCDVPFNVKCGERTKLQEAKGTNEFCPRKNGHFAHPDRTICNIFFNCINDVATKNECQDELHYSEKTGSCMWPNEAARTGCDKKKITAEGGFVCPELDKKDDKPGQALHHPSFSHPDDCQKYYVCIRGVDPREFGCPGGEVFNEETTICDKPENVKGCENWFNEEEDEE